ncbi:SDR family oxidoreductase [uncultured Massilia sp.]|uniref:SDR family oxidoreductase n=1 Tax=uncultured Massilia sp. TaxID=169973 RepID=UPI0025E3A061|nr:SDR family oxidoreductase [uncultured Massilia sp.]
MTAWNVADIPAQRGRTAVVTGTGGIGREIALALAAASADVIIAGRNAGKGQAAVEAVRRQVEGARVRFEALDLASLDSVDACARRLRARHEGIDLLVNNAAVMTPPQRRLSADGFELQFATNYLGHVALTAHLLPLLRARQDARVVTLSSVASRSGAIAFDDLQAQQRYRPMVAYAQSKLACLMFALELQRRSVAQGWGVASLAAHPGVARTDLLHNGAGRDSLAGRLRTHLWFLFQPAPQGALPALFAATARQAAGGEYYGPAGLGELRGAPAPARIPAQALDSVAAARLWAVSGELAGIAFPDAGGPFRSAPSPAR